VALSFQTYRGLMGTTASAADEPAAVIDPPVQECPAEVAAPWVFPVLGVTVVTLTSCAALVGLVGSDSRWLAALGRVIATRHAIPSGLPFAAAPTRSWPNPLVLAELVFHYLESNFGDRGLMLAQLLAVAAALTVIARDARLGGATTRAAATAVSIAALGALPSLSVARAQLFSLALFPLLVLLLRGETRNPSRRIWLLIPLVVIWSNLHGAVLIGVAVASVHLVVFRLPREPRTAVAVAIAVTAALCASPASVRGLAYYKGVLTNVAAQRGLGFSGAFTLTFPFDVATLAAAAVLLWRIRRVRSPLWEVVTIIVLSAITLHTSRSGVWLLLYLVAPAARGMAPKRSWDRFLPALATVSVVALAYAVVRGPLPTGASPAVIHRTIALSQGTPVLAEDLLNEQVVLAGGDIWVGNPIDAFSRHDQTVYLDWIEGRPVGVRAIGPEVRVVLTAASSPAQRLMDRTAGFVRVYFDRSAVIFSRRTSSGLR
jgi:hypothetical protein